MNFYLEITLLPNEEVNAYFLWSRVFQQIHLGLVEIQDEQNGVPVGISLPEYQLKGKCLLGKKLRLFAKDEETLIQFNVAKWLSRLSDYVHCTSIRPVPEKLLGYASYRRHQPQVNKERLARRYARRHSMDYDAALIRYDSMAHKEIETPFIRLKSLSSNQNLC